MENTETPKDPKDEKPSVYISPALRAKIAGRYEEEEEKGPGATIAVVGLIAVILICGALFLLGQKNAKNESSGQTAEAASAPAAKRDSAAAADSVARLASADSASRAMSQQMAANAPKPAPPPAAKPPAAKTAGLAAATAAAGAGAPAAAPAPARYGVAVGSFLFDDKAAAEKSRLGAATSLDATVMGKSDGTFDVVLGSFASRAEAEAKGAELLGAGTVKESRVVKLKK